MARNFTILLFVFLFSFSLVYAKDRNINKQLHQEKQSSCKTLKVFTEPVQEVYNNDVDISLVFDTCSPKSAFAKLRALIYQGFAGF